MVGVRVMDVFLVPVGGDRHELYCEHAEPEPPVDVASGGRSLRRRLTDAFHRALHEGEEERRRRRAGERADPSRGRMRRWITVRLAEAAAEQRLLWHLRRATHAQLIYPDDLTEARAGEIRDASLRTDLDKHRLWAVVDTAITVLLAPVALLPGPNLPAYYFVFRAVGHFLSMRGAQRGLRGVSWTYVGSAPLTELRASFHLDASARSAQVDATAAALGLERLAPFLAGASAHRS